MPFINKRSNLTPANARNSDVAHLLTETIAPIQQAKYQSAFLVQGISCILYSGLHGGRKCPCRTKNNTVETLAPDGKASPGAINRVLTGNENFGISDYNAVAKNLELDPRFAPTSPTDDISNWLGDLNSIGGTDALHTTQIENEPMVGDKGQYSPDFDDMFSDFDMSALGISDVSCPICFGTSYIGGYAPYKAWRKVLIPSDFETTSYYQLPELELSPGTHTVQIVLPRGALLTDVFRTMNNDKVTASQFYLDGIDVTHRNLLAHCDGVPHTLVIKTKEPMTHFEIQFGLSAESTYFEFPKVSQNSDISLLERTEAFQIVVSPDVPHMQVLDIIAESQSGKILIVQNVNPWNSRNRQMLGWECNVRVAQPQELWRILPFRRHVTGQKAVNKAIPSKSQVVSGIASKGLQF